MDKILDTAKSQESVLVRLENAWRNFLLNQGPDELVILSRGFARELVARNLPGATDALRSAERLSARKHGVPR